MGNYLDGCGSDSTIFVVFLILILLLIGTPHPC